eukprot:2419829-Pyramimonas_sp.AAC.1
MGFLLLAGRAGGTEREQNITSPPLTQTHSGSVMTRTPSSLRLSQPLKPTHHSDPFITQTHSSLRPTHHSDS